MSGGRSNEVHLAIDQDALGIGFARRAQRPVRPQVLVHYGDASLSVAMGDGLAPRTKAFVRTVETWMAIAEQDSLKFVTLKATHKVAVTKDPA